jgi:hypothetical protein
MLWWQEMQRLGLMEMFCPYPYNFTLSYQEDPIRKESKMKRLDAQILNQLACNIANLDFHPSDITKVAHAIATALNEAEFENAVNNLYIAYEERDK